MPIQPSSPNHQSTLPMDCLQPTDCTVFGTANVKVMPPTAQTVGRAPEYIRSKFQKNCILAIEELKASLALAANNYAAIFAILIFAEATEHAYMDAHVNIFVEANVKPGKTERDRTVSMPVHVRRTDRTALAGEYGEIISFSVHASQLVVRNKRTYIPLWLAKNKFRDVKNSARNKTQHSEYVPAGRRIWLDKTGLIASLLVQLPARRPRS